MTSFDYLTYFRKKENKGKNHTWSESVIKLLDVDERCKARGNC
jgi:hypothetical protein